MRYYLIAGERSGDLHAANLVRALKQHDAVAEFRGFGGDYMQEAGVHVTTHYRELAFMGFWEVLKNLHTVSAYLRRCQEDIKAYNPDVVILVDYGGFNLRMAAYAKKHYMRVFYYISPKVWAWNQNRAWKLKSLADRMFVILPFEKEFFKRFNWQVDYVGNPVLDAIRDFQPNAAFFEKHSLPKQIPLIALLPGSRKQELLNIIPILAEVVKSNPAAHFGVATVGNLNPELYAPLRDIHNVTFIADETYDLLHHSRAAIVTSGTATLETALFRVPQVVVYKTSYVSYRIAKALIRVPFISLVNLIAGKEVVKELIQQDASAANITVQFRKLLENDNRAIMLREYQNIYQALDTGSASMTAAKLMVSYLTNEIKA